MNILDIIQKKRHNKELSTEEIYYFIKSVSDKSIEDYQITSLLMAICINSMNERETIDLTNAMVASGETIDLSGVDNITIDKHSTGGVGDKTTLVIGPIMATFSLALAKMSGRGLGFTGGTLDKLEAIEGFNIEVNDLDFIKQVNDINIAVIGQTADIVPADKALYALRDVSATVDSIPLIAASVMSKKIASGAANIILDVKYGDGAFMKTKEDAHTLAKELVKIGNGCGRQTIAIVSSMDQPLGYEVGNANEIMEVIETLNGRGPNDLVELCVEIGSHFLQMTGLITDLSEGRELILSRLTNGSAYAKFIEFIKYQGASDTALEKLSKAENIYEVRADKSGYISQLLAVNIGQAATILGAGREKKTDIIDHSVGITLLHKIGEYVEEGDLLLTLNYNDSSNLDQAITLASSAIIISEQEVDPVNIIEEIVT